MSAPDEFQYESNDVPLQLDESDGSKAKVFRTDRFTGVVWFPAGTIEPAHHHTHGDMVYMLEGEIHLTHVAANKKYILKTGDYLYTPGGVSHIVHYVTDCKFLYINDGQFDGPLWDSDQTSVIQPKK